MRYDVVIHKSIRGGSREILLPWDRANLAIFFWEWYHLTLSTKANTCIILMLNYCFQAWKLFAQLQHHPDDDYNHLFCGRIIIIMPLFSNPHPKLKKYSLHFTYYQPKAKGKR